MPRGQTAKVGDTMVNVNGYHNTRTATGWRLTHQLIAEEKLGRPLDETEMVKFFDSDRSNLDPDNIVVIKKGKTSLRKQKAILEAKIEDLKGKLDEINRELEVESKLEG